LEHSIQKWTLNLFENILNILNDLLISTSVQGSLQRDNRCNIESYVNSKVREIREERGKSRESDECASRPYIPWTLDRIWNLSR